MYVKQVVHALSLLGVEICLVPALGNACLPSAVGTLVHFLPLSQEKASFPRFMSMKPATVMSP